MDQARMEELRRLSHELRDSSRKETRAAGKAILMLTDEIESLTVALDAARTASETAQAGASDGEKGSDETEGLETEEGGLLGSFRRRLRSDAD